MYLGAGNHSYDLAGHLVRVSQPTGGIGYGSYRTATAGCGLSGLNCPGCEDCKRKQAFSGLAAPGLDPEPEQTMGEAAGTWAHGAIDLVTWGFAGLVLYKFFLQPKLAEGTARHRVKRGRVRQAKRALAEARRERGFF